MILRTLLIAALFNPLRRWLGQAIDRWVLELPRDEAVLLDTLETGLVSASTPASRTISRPRPSERLQATLS